jgi:hypothetical protein
MKYFWTDREGYVGIDEEFMEVWCLLHRVWMHPHGRSCLAFGSGRGTVAYWVKQVTGERVDPTTLRQVLELGVALEWVIPSRSPGNYRIFNLRPIRYIMLLPKELRC